MSKKEIKKSILIVCNKHEKEELNELLKNEVFVWFEWKFKVNIIDVNIMNTSINYEEKVYDTIVEISPDIVISLWIEVTTKFLKNDFPQLKFQWKQKRFRNIKEYMLYCWRWIWYYKIRKTEEVLITHLRWILRSNLIENDKE